MWVKWSVRADQPPFLLNTIGEIMPTNPTSDISGLLSEPYEDDNLTLTVTDVDMSTGIVSTQSVQPLWIPFIPHSHRCWITPYPWDEEIELTGLEKEIHDLETMGYRE